MNSGGTGDLYEKYADAVYPAVQSPFGELYALSAEVQMLLYA